MAANRRKPDHVIVAVFDAVYDHQDKDTVAMNMRDMTIKRRIPSTIKRRILSP
jgi:hypothetical protein